MPRVTKDTRIAELQNNVETLIEANRQLAEFNKSLGDRNAILQDRIMTMEEECREVIMTKVRIINELMMHPDLHQVTN